jgi:hypothetical protein
MTAIDSRGGGGRVANEDQEPKIATSTSTPSSSKENASFRNGLEERGIEEQKEEGKQPLWKRVYTVLAWTPPNCRWDPDKPPQFSMSSTYLP